MQTNVPFGKEGEVLAENYLIKKGFTILRRNWYHQKKELDIICTINNIIVFVEVKTRNTNYFENPKEAVTRKKQRFIIEAANAYIEKYNIDLEARFDIISIVFQGKKYEIEHIEDAFYPMIK